MIGAYLSQWTVYSLGHDGEEDSQRQKKVLGKEEKTNSVCVKSPNVVYVFLHAYLSDKHS